MLVSVNQLVGSEAVEQLRRCAGDLNLPFVEVVELEKLPKATKLVVISNPNSKELKDWLAKPLTTQPALAALLDSGSGEEVVSLLEAGADDVLCDPYSYAELRARCASLLRRRKVADQGTEKQVGDFSLDYNRRTIKLKDNEVVLRRREFELLHYFFQNANRPVSRDQLLSRVWSDNPILNDNNLDVQVRQLRQKFGEQGRDYIVTLHGYGYKLCTNGNGQATSKTAGSG